MSQLDPSVLLISHKTFWLKFLTNLLYAGYKSFQVLKLQHAMRNISLLNFLIMEQNAAVNFHSPPTSSAPPAIDRTFFSNPDPRNYKSTNPCIHPPVLPGEYQQAMPSSGAPFELQFNSAVSRNPGPLPLQPHSHLVTDSQFSQLPLGAHVSYSALPSAQHDTVDPEVRIRQRVWRDQESNENLHSRHYTVSLPSMGFLCPLLSCSRNQCTPPKSFGRTDSLRTHLKKVHSLPITDGIRLSKWIAENSGVLKDAEDRARASLLLKY
ncbi:hypothetical protein EV426DRAFT_287711 [Tirmania nivea]|nr:hypothetical protein EV426DRAFT_287711 [Tirmania nivea]